MSLIILLPTNGLFFCDRVWSKELCSGGFAAVTMKDNIIFGCIAGWMNTCTSIVEAEIRGLLAGLDIARNLHLENVDNVSDNVEAIWSCNGGDNVARSAGMRSELMCGLKKSS